MEPLPSPFGDPAPNLSDSELRETAYEILVAACRTTGSRPLTFIPQSPKSDRTNGVAALSPSPSLHRSLTSTAASRVKKALGMKKRSGGGDVGGEGGESSGQPDRVKKSVTVGELVRVQMRISEQIDSRIRRALLRIASGQLGRRVETMVLPLELLQQLKATDFPDHDEYISWQRRNLKLLEAGLILHPHVPLSKADRSVQQLKQIIRSGLERPLDTGKITGESQNLRSVVMSLATRPNNDGIGPDTCHWADGFPLNLRIYQMLLESCFDVNDELSVVEEVDEVLELIKKTWPVLGMNQMVHNVCFLWVLFNRYVATGQVENDLLVAAHNLILEVENDAKETNDPRYSKISSSVLSLILDWAEKRLLAYHDTFNIDNVETLETTVSLGISVAKVLGEDASSEYRRKKKSVDSGRDRVDTYIRSSLRMAFSQTKKMVEHSKRSKSRQTSTSNLPALAILAEDIGHLAFNEKAIFSPILKNWHPLSAGVAAATLHSCYGAELKKFVSGITELTPDAIRVLTAADKLEKDLVQIAVQDAVDSDDGGKSVIREMPPFEAEVVIGNLVKSWIKTRVDRLKEWIDRNLQQEAWNPKLNKLGIAPSSVDVLRMVDETLEAFFLLPILLHTVLLPELTSGLDKCMQHYVAKAKSSCGSRNTFLPALPALTRCSVGSRLHGVFKKKEKPMAASNRRKSQLGTGNDSAEILQFCCRINTLHYIRTEMESSGRKTLNRLPESDIASFDGKAKIFNLIARHNIKWLVMGAASDKHYSWRMTDLKSKKAIFVCKKAPDSCHIWFLCKGYLIFTRATNDDSNNRQTMPPLVQLDSDTETRRSEKLESSYMRRRLRYWRSLLEQDGEKDTGQLEREKVEPRRTTHLSSGSSSSFGEQVVPELASPEVVGSDTRTPSNVEEKKREGKVAGEVHRYDKAMHDISQSERTVYGEARNEWKEGDSTMEALCKAKALEGLCIKEQSRRKKLEELLEKETGEVKTVVEQNNGFMKKLQIVRSDNLKLESQIKKLQDLEKEHGEKFDTAMELLKSFRQKRDEIRIDHENAIKEVNALRRLVKGKSIASSGSEVLDYSFMEINKATDEFDPSWKLGEGKYGSVYKGNLQNLQVAVKMLPSYGSQNHIEFERQVEILSRVRHPNLVTIVGTCPESRSLIYQYIPNGSLEDCFSSANNVPALPWESRIRIASEICSALLFLHSNVPCIIHGNLKPSKILLDSNLVTKISDYGISQLIPIDGIDKSDPHVDPHYFVSGEMTLESDIYSFGMILLQLLTRRPLSGVLRDVKCAVENDNISAVLDNSAGDWPVARGKKLANIAIRCCKKNPLNRPDLPIVLRVIDRMKAPEGPLSETSSYANQKVPRKPPSHYLCPIFQEVMKDPLIAADGFTYEAEAIREWLANGHDTSPMTNLKMEDCNLIPNHALHLAIQDWQNQW